MYFGKYEFDGDPDELLAAYDRLMDTLGGDGISFHACVRTDRGIAIYDCCPDEEIFRAFSSSDGMAAALEAAGLPPAAVTPIGAVHSARTAAGVVDG